MYHVKSVVTLHKSLWEKHCRCRLCCWWLVAELKVLQKVWSSTDMVQCQ